jgi:hypothetical protein
MTEAADQMFEMFEMQGGRQQDQKDGREAGHLYPARYAVAVICRGMIIHMRLTQFVLLDTVSMKAGGPANGKQGCTMLDARAHLSSN